MTATTTATLIVSPAAGGPFSTPVWRVGVFAQLVEGSGSPYWLVRNPDSETDQYVPIPAMDAFTVAQSVLVTIALTVGSENLKEILREHHNFVGIGPETRPADCWDLSDGEINLISANLSSRLRLGFTQLDPMTCLVPGALNFLLDWGFEVDFFR